MASSFAKPVRASRQIVEPGINSSLIAQLHQVTTQTVRAWAERGEFGTYRLLPNNRLEVPLSQYQAFVERHELQADPHTR